MDTAITLKDLGAIIIGVGLVVLIGYAINLLRSLVATVRSINRILADTETVSGIMARRAGDADETIAAVSESISSVSDMLKGQQSTVAAFSTLINAIGSLKNIIFGNKQGGAQDGGPGGKSAGRGKRGKQGVGEAPEGSSS
ncbi:MAG: hypothetical protein LBH39_03300 [Clostridiales Family XIII bacterium]|jgi:hypothetical protein|nr:hypothetical protein [Clostridiales Family XIII bacterium]